MAFSISSLVWMILSLSARCRRVTCSCAFFSCRLSRTSSLSMSLPFFSRLVQELMFPWTVVPSTPLCKFSVHDGTSLRAASIWHNWLALGLSSCLSLRQSRATGSRGCVGEIWMMSLLRRSLSLVNWNFNDTSWGCRKLFNTFLFCWCWKFTSNDLNDEDASRENIHFDRIRRTC